MVLEKKNGMMVVSIKDSTKMHPKRVKENTAGQMAIGMLVNGKIICSTEEVSSCGTMIDYSLESGKTT